MTMDIPEDLLIPDPPPHLRPKVSNGRRRFWLIFDWSILVVALFLLPGTLDTGILGRFQPANPWSWYLRILLPLLFGLSSALRYIFMPRWVSYRHRRNSVLTGIGVPASLLLFQVFKTLPSAVYFWSGILTPGPGTVVRMTVHHAETRTSLESEREIHENFITLSLPDDPRTFEINADRFSELAADDGYHDIEGRLHTGLFGLRWIDRESLRGMPDIYRMAAFDRTGNKHLFREYKGRYLVFVAVGECPAPDAPSRASLLSAAQRDKNAVVIRFRCRDTCNKPGEWDFADEITREKDPRFPLLGNMWLGHYLETVTGLREQYRAFHTSDVVTYGPDGEILFVLREHENTVAELKDRLTSFR